MYINRNHKIICYNRLHSYVGIKKINFLIFIVWFISKTNKATSFLYTVDSSCTLQYMFMQDYLY